MWILEQVLDRHQSLHCQTIGITLESAPSNARHDRRNKGLKRTKHNWFLTP
jgi:hypothetical protein